MEGRLEKCRRCDGAGGKFAPDGGMSVQCPDCEGTGTTEKEAVYIVAVRTKLEPSGALHQRTMEAITRALEEIEKLYTPAAADNVVPLRKASDA